MDIAAKLPISWFDLVFVCLLIAGLFRGRKNGMSGELLPLLQWLTILFVCSEAYESVGNTLAATAQLSRLFSYVAAYVGLAILVKAGFSLIKSVFKGKPLSADFFGRTEYYFGMLAGMARFGCMIVFVLALLNARLYTEAEIMRDIQFQRETYGAQFFPKLYTVQNHVFVQSTAGAFIRQHLGRFLIKPTPAEKVQFQRQEWQPPW
ncbi:MAG: CvpA family protein [Verrucomicrobiae bacterium]|nr:CvpA family protein [Verrucomicrobiae bacterium]MCX7721450.1 CvpA family protein [Verrucomicrobiae bacterium]MDW7979575.1 CvpA family protein [Verrucomicrobiales bacterium]